MICKGKRSTRVKRKELTEDKRQDEGKRETVKVRFRRNNVEKRRES